MSRWVGTWAASPHGPIDGHALMMMLKTKLQFRNQTMRQIVRTTIAGDQVRVQFSNGFGTQPVLIGAIHIALRSEGSQIIGGTDRKLTFKGKSSTVVPPGGVSVSDSVELSVPALQDLAVSIYFPDGPGTTAHGNSLQTCYISPPGNHAGASEMPVTLTLQSWVGLTGIDVMTPDEASAVAAFGDCVTDGLSSTIDRNRRWVDILSERLLASGRKIAVLNAAIAGNRLLHDGPAPFGPLFGPSGLSRFDRDVLGLPGLKQVIVVAGITDISHPGSNAPLSQEVSSAKIIEGLQQLIDRGRKQNLRVLGGTLTPFEGAATPGFPNIYSAAKEAKRQEVNRWICSSRAFDGVIDFDGAVRDPAHPAKLLPLYDSGDHLHLNDAGHKAMAEAIDLALLC